MKKSLMIGLIGLSVMGSAHASTIFSCKVASGKTVQVSHANGQLHYRFGKSIQSPEISLSTPVSKAVGDFHRHSFFGYYITSIGIKSGSYTYVVTEGYGESGNFYDLSVRKGANYAEIATHRCVGRVISNLDSVLDYVRPAELI